jgi:hypothetical protein
MATQRGYKVTQRRSVPMKYVGVTLTGRVVEEVPTHAGERAAHVQLDSGFGAWGFGATDADAEAAAVASARKLEG